MIDPKHLADRIVGLLTWIITSPFAFLLWVTAAVIALGLGFGYINAFAGTRLPTFGIQAQSSIYAAGIVYLLHGRV